MTNTLEKTPFYDSLLHDLAVTLSQHGCHFDAAGNTFSADEKAQSWSDAIATGLIKQEPLLTAPNLFWRLSSGKGNLFAMEGFDDQSMRLTHRFFVRVVQKQTYSKNQIVALTQQTLEIERDQTALFPMAASTQKVYKDWKEQHAKGLFDWEDINPSITQSWQHLLLSSIRENLEKSGLAEQSSFLNFCFGEQDSYWICKIPRKNELAVLPVSRTGRMTQEPTLKMDMSTSAIIKDEFGVRLDIHLTNGAVISGRVQDTRNSKGFAIKYVWSLNLQQYTRGDCVVAFG